MRKRFLQFLAAAVCAASLPGLLPAQIGGGSIVGFVTDPSSASIVGVSVRAINLGTNASQETKTNAEGYYEFPLLPAGRYRLEAESTGFRKTTSAEFVLNTGTRPRIDLTLALADVAESVQVTATAPLVNATTTDLGVVMETAKVESLPLNGRDFQQLVGLQAGVLVAPPGGAGGRGGIEFHGSPALGNNLLLDGVDMTFGEVNGSANDTSAGASGGSLINTVSVEAIQEFKATGSAFSAEYGRASGGVLNITTKSGTNDFHGTLFEFFRNDKLDANSFFSNLSGLPKPPLRWNQFGGNLGGPVKRDKLFFFGNYEGAIVRRNSQVTGNVATPALLQQVNPEIRDLLTRMMPSDFTPTSNPLIGFHRRNDNRRNDEHTFLSRVDWNASESDRLSVRYSYNHQDYSEPLLFPALPRVYPMRFNNAVVQHSRTLSPTMFNELRLGVNRVNLFRRETGREEFPAWVNVAGTGPNASLPSYIHFITTTYTLADNFSVIRGRHSIKAGFEIRDVRSVRGQGGQPTHAYNSLADLIADRPNRITLLFGGGKGLRTWNHGYYIQDDWRISSRFQLNLGLRYEYYPPLKGGFNFTSSDPFSPFTQPGEPMFAADKNNFAPRAGFVWDVLGNQKLVVRAGGGISYLPMQPIVYYDMAFIDPRLPFVAQFAPGDLGGVPTAFPFSQSFVDSVSANPSLFPSTITVTRRGADYYSRTEYSGQWNYSMQYAVSSKLALQASYVGSRGINLYTARTLNLVDPALGRRPFPEYGDVVLAENSGRSWYHGLQISVNQRLWNGLTTDTYYTWAKNMGYNAPDSTITTDGAVQDPNNIAGSIGPRQADIRHRFINVHSWAVPVGSVSRNAFASAILGGWTVQGIMTWRSGLPVNVTSGVDLYGNGRVSGQRPDLVPAVDPYIRDTDRLVWLNAAAFDNATPRAERRFGNLGYNALRGPSGFTYDAALHKAFLFRERQRLTFRFEMFNALNHKVLSSPNATVSNPNFGRILGASGGRNIQLALKYMF